MTATPSSTDLVTLTLTRADADRLANLCESKENSYRLRLEEREVNQDCHPDHVVHLREQIQRYEDLGFVCWLASTR